jgi:hypothetical protein
MALSKDEIDDILYYELNNRYWLYDVKGYWLYDVEDQKAIDVFHTEAHTEARAVNLPRVEMLNAMIDNDKRPQNGQTIELTWNYLSSKFSDFREVFLKEIQTEALRALISSESVYPMSKERLYLPLLKEVADRDEIYLFDRSSDHPKIVHLDHGSMVDQRVESPVDALAFCALHDTGDDFLDTLDGGRKVDAHYLEQLDPIPFTKESIMREWGNSIEGRTLLSEAIGTRTDFHETQDFKDAVLYYVHDNRYEFLSENGIDAVPEEYVILAASDQDIRETAARLGYSQDRIERLDVSGVIFEAYNNIRLIDERTGSSIQDTILRDAIDAEVDQEINDEAADIAADMPNWDRDWGS